MTLSRRQTKLSKECPSRENRVSDFNYSLRYIRWLFRLLGVWPLVTSRPSKIEYVFSKHVLLPFISISMLSLTMPICYYVVSRPMDRYEKIVLLGPITYQSTKILIHFTIILRTSLIKVCFEHMKLDWQSVDSPKERDIMTRYLHSSHSLTIACLSFIYTSALAYLLIMPLLSGNKINEMNETIRPQPFPGAEVFFDVQKNVVYESVYAFNFLCALLHFSVGAAICVLAIVFVSHACGQIEIVVLNLDTFVRRIIENQDTANLTTKRIGFVIDRHVRLLEFAMNIEKTMRQMMLIEVVGTTLVMCIVQYDILLILEGQDSKRTGVLTYAMLFVSFAFNLFLNCQFGEVLKGQCEKIGKKAYFIDWSELPRNTKLALIMIINISNYPYKLTAGGMMDLSVFNFVSILKSSFAYFNMMRTMS